MQFLYPSFLWALLLLAVPIIIHLFHFRRFKKVLFTNVRFLKELKEETTARSKLKNLLVLLARLLALAALVLAFAQPFIPQDTTVDTKRKAVSIFVDNSFSMEALSEDVSIFNRAKQNASEIINAFQEEDRIQVLTHDFEGRHQRLVDKAQALSYVEELEISPNVRRISQILDRQQQLLNNESDASKFIYLISDFQKSIVDEIANIDTSILVNVLPIQSVQEQNLSIDSAWFESPVQTINQTNRLIVRVRNHSNIDLENIRLSIEMDGQQKPIGTIAVPANGFVDDTINVSVLKSGWQMARLNITDYPVQFDDDYFITFEVAQEVNVLNISEQQSNRYLKAALDGLQFFKMESVSSRRIDYSKLGNYDLIVLDELLNISSGLASSLQQYIRGGGNVVVFPNPKSNLDGYNAFFDLLGANRFQPLDANEREVISINQDAFVFKDVYLSSRRTLKLPSSKSNFRCLRSAISREEILLTYRDGSAMLSQYRIEDGNLFVSTVPLDPDYSDMATSGEIFVPMLYKMALSRGGLYKISQTIGKDEILVTSNQITNQGDDMIYKIRGSNGQFIPEQRSMGSKVILNINQQIKESGFYDLILKEGESLESYGYNYDRRESDLSYFSQNEILTLAGDNVSLLDVSLNTNLTAMIGEKTRGIILWKWCLILVLIFLALEALILRFWN